MLPALWKAFTGTGVVLGFFASAVTLIVLRGKIGNAIDEVLPAVRPIGEALVWVVGVFVIVVALSVLAKNPIQRLLYASSGQRDIDRLRELSSSISRLKEELMSFGASTLEYESAETVNSRTLGMVKELGTFARYLHQMGIATPAPKLSDRENWVYFLTELGVSVRHGDLAESVRIGKAYAEPSDTE